MFGDSNKKHSLRDVQDALKQITMEMEEAENDDVMVNDDVITLAIRCWMRPNNKAFFMEVIRTLQIHKIERGSSPEDVVLKRHIGPIEIRIVCPVDWVCDKVQTGETVTPTYEYKLKPELVEVKI